jgi:hypothetical protein
VKSAYFVVGSPLAEESSLFPKSAYFVVKSAYFVVGGPLAEEKLAFSEKCLLRREKCLFRRGGSPSRGKARFF